MATSKVDYAIIEPAWRAGIKTPDQLAKEYTEQTGVSVSRTAIIKHFAKKGIERNLAAKIQAKADAMVNESMVTGEVREKLTIKENLIIAEGALAVANIKKAHRDSAKRSRELVEKLTKQLESFSPIEIDKDEQDPEKLKAQKAAALSWVKENASVLKQLVETQRIAVAMEREAFGITQYVDPAEENSKTDEADSARRLLFFISKLAAQPGGNNHG